MNKNKDEFNGVPIVIKIEDKEIGKIQTFVETKKRVGKCVEIDLHKKCLHLDKGCENRIVGKIRMGTSMEDKGELMLEWTDKKLEMLDELFKSVLDENLKQLSKWGVQNHSCFEWMCFLTEEVGELAQAISEAHYRGADKDKVFNEAIQVATLALKIAEMSKD